MQKVLSLSISTGLGFSLHGLQQACEVSSVLIALTACQRLQMNTWAKALKLKSISRLALNRDTPWAAAFSSVIEGVFSHAEKVYCDPARAYRLRSSDIVAARTEIGHCGGRGHLRGQLNPYRASQGGRRNSQGLG